MLKLLKNLAPPKTQNCDKKLCENEIGIGLDACLQVFKRIAQISPKTDPSEKDPPETEPSKTDPSENDPSKTDLPKSDLSKTDSPKLIHQKLTH